MGQMAPVANRGRVVRGLRKDFRKLAEKMQQAGWRLDRRKKHLRAYAPDGVTTVCLPGSPSDVRSLKNAEAVFKRWEREWGLRTMEGSRH